MNAVLQVVDGPGLRRTLEAGQPLDADAHTLAALDPLPAVDLLHERDGWLGRLATAAAAPLVLSHFALVPRQVAGLPVGVDSPVHELDAFALASVYEQVVWDDRAPGWHATSGRKDSSLLLRAIHDLALRADRGYAKGERLVLTRSPPHS